MFRFWVLSSIRRNNFRVVYPIGVFYFLIVIGYPSCSLRRIIFRVVDPIVILYSLFFIRYYKGFTTEENLPGCRSDLCFLFFDCYLIFIWVYYKRKRPFLHSTSGPLPHRGVNYSCIESSLRRYIFRVIYPLKAYQLPG